MGFPLTNFTVSILILLSWTAFMIYVRLTSSPETNWPLIYWAAMAAVAMKCPDTTWKFTWVAAGLAFCLLLRFEFINNAVANLFRVCEMVAFGYVLYWGVRLLYT